MASFLNTGILGQVTGGSLGLGSLSKSFGSFRDRVKSQRKRRPGVTTAEREAVEARRQRRLKASEVDTGIAGGIDTSDVSPTDATKGITTAISPVTTGPSTDDLSPETKFTEAEGSFVKALSDWERHIMGKNTSGINKGRSQTQGYLQNVVDLAKATGREDLIGAVGSIEGILGQRDISTRNVGQAKASTSKALGAVRETLDIERIMKELNEGVTAPKVTTGTRRRIASQGVTSRRR